MAYVAEYQRPYEGGYVDLPDESTPEMAAFMNARDDALLKIEQFLANLDLSGLGSDYALLSEAGYSLGLGIDSNYVMTISLKNKEGGVLSSKQIDFPIESMVVNAVYEDGKITLTLQNGNTLPIDISDMVRGLVPTTRKIAGIDLADDITKEELKSALELGGGASGEIPTKVSQLENDAGYITQEDIAEAGSVSVGEIKPWLYDEAEEVVIGVYNGKPLYRKMFQIMVNCPANRFVTYKISDYVQNVDVISNCICRDEYDGLLYPVFFMNTSITSSRSVIIAKREDFIYFTCDTNIALIDVLHTFVMEYTKTTDAEGSGNDLKPYGIYDAKLDELASSKENIAITETTETTMPNSHDGRFLFKKIKGAYEQVTTTGAQLFDGNLLGGYYESVDGTPSGDTSIYKTIKFSVTEAGDYTFSFCVEAFVIRLDGSLINKANTVFTYNLETGNHYISFRNTGSTVWNNSVKIMLNKGNTALPWEPYTGGLSAPNPSYTQEIKKSVVSEIKTHEKNLLNPNTCVNGLLDASGVLTTSNAWVTSDYIEVTSGEKNSVSSSAMVVRFAQYDENKNFIKYNGNIIGVNDSSYAPWTTTLASNTKYVRVTFGLESAMTPTELFKNHWIQIEEGEPTSYEPYKESSITLSNPIDLYGIGDVQDTIEDGKVRRKFAKDIFDGSEEWTTSSLVDGRYVFMGLGAKGVKRSQAPLCTHAKGSNYTSIINKCSIDDNGALFINTSFATIDEWKAHLQSNPMTVVYELAEETTEELSIADQIALNSLATYDGITYLEFDSEVQPTFEGEYGTSKVGGYTLEGMLAGRNGELYGKRVEALEATVVNNI